MPLKHDEPTAEEASMHVGGVHAVKRRRRAAATPPLHAPASAPARTARRNAPAQPRRDARVKPAPAAPLPAARLGAPVSRVGGEWPVDMVRAKADAQFALNSIDWSKKDIVIWVPGTGNHFISPALEAAVRESWKDGGVSLSRVEYESTWNVRSSVPTGVETMKLILAGIAAHGGDYNIMLVGESQGAWIMGEALADPLLRKVVDRAVMMGHPWVAAHHYDDGHDKGILEINHAGDMITMPINGDQANALDAMVALRSGEFWKIGSMAAALLDNPQLGVSLLKTVGYATLFKGIQKDPHDYNSDVTRAVEFLRYGRTNDASAYDVEPARRRALRALQANAVPA